MKTQDTNAYLRTAEKKEMNSGLLWSGFAYSSKGWNDSALMAAWWNSLGAVVSPR